MDVNTHSRLDIGVGPYRPSAGPADEECTGELEGALAICADNSTERLTCCSALAELGPGCLATLESLVSDDTGLVAGLGRVLELCGLTLNTAPPGEASPSQVTWSCMWRAACAST